VQVDDHRLTLVGHLDAGVSQCLLGLLLVLDEDVNEPPAVPDQRAETLDVDPGLAGRLPQISQLSGLVLHDHRQVLHRDLRSGVRIICRGSLN
jgi:hypothetical protein